MAFRLYIVPVVGSGLSITDARRPKYFNSTDGIISTGQSWSVVDFGFEPVMIVGADLITADDLLVAQQPDAISLPFNLAVTLNAGQVTTTRARLESLHIPALWVNTSLTWVSVVRTVLGMFSFLQRYSGIYARQNGISPPSLFVSGVTLETLFGGLPVTVQTALIETAVSFGFSTAGLTANTTVRVVLKALADNFQAQQYNFNGVLV